MATSAGRRREPYNGGGSGRRIATAHGRRKRRLSTSPHSTSVPINEEEGDVEVRCYGNWWLPFSGFGLRPVAGHGLQKGNDELAAERGSESFDVASTMKLDVTQYYTG